MATPLMYQCIIKYIGWDSHQFDLPVPLIPESLGIRICIHYREYGNESTEQCVGHGGCFPAMRDVMLDDNEALNYLSSQLSTMGIPIDVQPQIVSEIIFCYRNTNSSITRKSEKDLPVIVFKIVFETWMSYNEEEAAARAIEESMEADTCKPIPAAKSAIDALEEVILIDCSESTEQCVICLENLDLGLQVRRLPCWHMFHGDCISKWLETSHLCPLCRLEMPTQLC